MAYCSCIFIFQLATQLTMTFQLLTFHSLSIDLDLDQCVVLCISRDIVTIIVTYHHDTIEYSNSFLIHCYSHDSMVLVTSYLRDSDKFRIILLKVSVIACESGCRSATLLLRTTCVDSANGFKFRTHVRMYIIYMRIK